MSFKRNLVLAALVTFLMAPMGNTNYAHAANITLDQYASPWEKRAGITHWHATAYKGTHYKKGVPGNQEPNFAITTYHKNGHSFQLVPIFDSPGKIVGVDGNLHASNAQVMSALNHKMTFQNRITLFIQRAIQFIDRLFGFGL